MNVLVLADLECSLTVTKKSADSIRSWKNLGKTLENCLRSFLQALVRRFLKISFQILDD